MSHITITLLKEMWVGVSIFLLLVFFLNKMTIFRKTLTTSNPTWRHKILFILVFSFIGLCGLYWNIPMDGGLINFRSVGPIVGGIIGGPVVGTISGMIVGGCRVLVYNTTANEIHGITTVMQGIIAGLLSKTIKSRPHMWLHSFICTALIEYGSVLFLFSMFHPSMDEREYILETIFPIVVTNSIAVSLFMGVLEDSVQLAQRSSSFAAKTTFTSVNLMLQTIHTGLTAVNLQQISDIIIRSLPDVAAISLSAGKERVQTVTANAEDPAFIRKSFALAHESQSIHPKRYIWFSKIDYHEHLSAEMIVIKRKGNPFTQFEINFLEGMQELIKTIVQFNHLKKEEELLKESEIRMLQAQINPHFLFNTLNTINYYCMADPETAMDLIGYLSDYYRYSLSNPRSMVPISEELEDIQVYVNLESARFADRLHVEYRFPKNIQFKIPPLLLQPLVENAIEHGICASSKGGTIKMGVIEHANDYKLYVLDSGVGMDKKTLDSLLTETGQRNRIGLINVHMRLLSLFGESSGLKIHSRKGKGTVVSFRIPKGGGNHESSDSRTGG